MAGLFVRRNLRRQRIVHDVCANDIVLKVVNASRILITVQFSIEEGKDGSE